jgi:acetylornithine deacetylase/succinyl-diaminopimelate desuccinylase-like protein
MLRRAAGCLLMALALVALAAPRVVAQAPVPRSPWDSLARDLLRQLVETNTSQSSGSTLAAAQAMAARLKAAGFPDSDVVVLSNAPRKGNLIARIHGRQTGKKPIMLLAHIDVVEAKAEDWTLPPFQFIEKDGIFYGRGTADDKDEAAVGTALFIRMKQERYVPDRDIILALTTDEEGGPDNGVEWLLKNRPDLMNVEYALNEGGGGWVREGKKIAHYVQASEKKVQNFRIETTNPGGHSSQPVKDNAITQLAAALVELGAFDFPVHLNAVTEASFRRSADIVGGEMGAAMRAIVANPGDAAAARKLSEDKTYNSILRTTCVSTMLDGGHATNALPQRARANVNCRILPDESPVDVQAALERVIGDPKVTVTPVGEARNSPPSPLTPALMSQIERITSEMWPGISVVPTMSTGATDGMYLRNAGIPTYGVSGQFYPDTGAHGMNERIPAQAFYQGLEFMYRLVKSLTGPGVT